MTLGRSRTGGTSRRLPAHASLWAAVLTLALSSPVLAQPAGAPSADADLSTQARELYKKGADTAKLGQWDRARVFYLGAWRVQHHWQIAASLGRAELKVDKPRDAAEHLQFALSEAAKLKPQDKDKADRLERAKVEIQELLAEAKAKVGTLTLTVDPPGTELSVNGGSVGKAPLQDPVFVEPGPWLVEGRLPGYTPAKEARELTAGAADTVVLHLVKEPPQAKGPGAGLGPGPLPPVKEEKGPNMKIVVAGAIATGVVGLAGVGFNIGAAIKQDERGLRKEFCTPQAECDRYNAAEGARGTFAFAAVISYVTAGVLGAGTLTYVVLNPAAKPRNAAKAELLLGPGTAGAMITVPW